MKLIHTVRTVLDLTVAHGTANPIVFQENNFRGLVATDVSIGIFENTPASGGTRSNLICNIGPTTADITAGMAGSIYFYNASSAAIDLSQALDALNGIQMLSLVPAAMSVAPKPLVFNAIRLWLDEDRLAGNYDCVVQFFNRYLEPR